MCMHQARRIKACFNHYAKYHTKFLLGNFNAKVGREYIFEPKIGNESLHQDSNNNDVRIIDFPNINLILKSTMFLHRNIHKYTWTSPDRNNHSQIDHILNSSILDDRSFKGG